MIPEFQKFFYPFLKLCSDNKEHSLNEMRDYLTEYFSLSEEDKTERVPSGTQTKFDNRIYWAKSYFIKANLIKNIKRSVFGITATGIDFFKKYNSSISINDLKTINEFRKFSIGTTVSGDDYNNSKGITDSTIEEKTPEEILEDSFSHLKKDLADTIIEKIKNCSPSFFEHLVVDLLVKMGYGGSIKDAGKIIGKSGDGGIDGIIKEDKLGLDIIYVQAKRWENTVPISQIRDFAGSLLSKKPRKEFLLQPQIIPKAHMSLWEVLSQKLF